MRSNFLSKFLLLLCLLLVLSSVGGVFAIWQYAEDPSASVADNVPFTLGEFKWEGSEILPDDVEGEDHAWLIKSLVSGTLNGKVIGLDNPDSALNEYISDRLAGGLG